MGESSPDRHDVALWLQAAARLVNKTDAEILSGLERGDLDTAVRALTRRALAWLDAE